MTSYLLIESRDPFESRGFGQRCDLAATMVAGGAAVTLFLVENGVLAARASARAQEIEKLSRSGVSVLADEFALRERGIAAAELAPSVKSTGLDELVKRLAAGAKSIWN